MGNWQDPHYLTNLTHLDGRNAAKVIPLRPYFSELAWMKERLLVMSSHLIAVSAVLHKPLRQTDIRAINALATNFSLADGEEVVALEKTVNHDLKALELFLAAKLSKHLSEFKRYILFGLGSEDINSIAFARLIQSSRGDVLLPQLYTLVNRMAVLATKQKDTIMVARTHGLPAGVTTLGKELANPLLRLCDEINFCVSLQFQAKVSGEVGSMHGLSRTGLPVNWLAFGDRFIRSLGVEPYHGSTQIVPYDSLIRYLHSLYRVNSICIDICKNMWLYILLGYVRVVKKEKEVGSSGMPHKVNPIYFEGAEGGLVMANGLIETLARALMINRLQRDFSDSTVRRNTVLILAYSLLSYQSIVEAFERLDVNGLVIGRDLSEHAEVWIEPIKIIMLMEGLSDAFELLKRKTRGNSYTTEELQKLVDTLPLNDAVHKKIHRLIHGKISNPYPGRIVREAVAKAKKLQAL